MRTFVFTCLLLLGMTTFAQDANFHIYLCLGQSNMEGNAKVEEQDTVAVDSRFQVLAAVDCPNLGRTKGNWYKAVPPLARCYTGLTPGDYFGRAMVANLPSNVRVGIINVAVGGCRIELFDKDNYQSYVETSPDWLKNMVKEYGGNPYEGQAAQNQAAIKKTGRKQEREERIRREEDIDVKSVSEIEQELREELAKEMENRKRKEEERELARRAEEELAEAEKIIEEKEALEEAEKKGE